jgi:hypothetical protein
MRITGLGKKVMHFVHVEVEGEVHEIPIDKQTYTLLNAISPPTMEARAQKTDDDWVNAFTNQDVDSGGNGAPKPLGKMPPDLAAKMASIGVELPSDIDVHREEEQDPGEVFQDAEADEGEEAASL